MSQNILNKLQQDKLILSKVEDKINFCIQKNQIQNTDFLDLSQKQLISKFLKTNKISNYIFYGAFDKAERNILLIYPQKLESLVKENKIDYSNIISVIRIELPNENKGQYTHRDYLGGLMKIGIKREKIGDILVDENGADIIINKDIEKFLLLNLSDLTRFSKSKIEKIDIENLRKLEIKKEEILATVSSMRLDNIVSEIAKCSRNKANEIIMQERVFVNFEVVTKNTKIIKENDLITIRGKGRFKVLELVHNTRKGRIIVKIEKNI